VTTRGEYRKALGGTITEDNCTTRNDPVRVTACLLRPDRSESPVIHHLEANES
jgi:hypothetical protein